MRLSRLYPWLLLRCLLYLSITASLAMNAFADARPKILFTCSLPASAYRLALEQAYAQSFARLGYDFSISTFPVARGLKMLNSGRLDGDCSRSETLLDNLNNSAIVKVKTIIRTTDYGIWSHLPDLRINSIDDLKKQPYRIGYSNGTRVVEEFLQRNSLTNTIAVEGMSNGLRMLSAQRFDLFLTGNGLVYEQHKDLDLRNPIYMSGILFHDRSYPYLHKKHEKLRPKLEAELKKLIPPEGIPVDRR